MSQCDVHNYFHADQVHILVAWEKVHYQYSAILNSHFEAMVPKSLASHHIVRQQCWHLCPEFFKTVRNLDGGYWRLITLNNPD